MENLVEALENLLICKEEVIVKLQQKLKKIENQRLEALEYIASVLNSEDRQYLCIGYDDLDRVHYILAESSDK